MNELLNEWYIVKLVSSFIHIRLVERTFKWINISEMKMRKQTPDAINANVLTPVTEHKYTTPVAKLVVDSTCNSVDYADYIFQITLMSQKRTAHKTTTTKHIHAIIIVMLITGGTDLHCFCDDYMSRLRVHVIGIICMQSSIFRIKVSGADIFIAWPLALKWAKCEIPFNDF